MTVINRVKKRALSVLLLVAVAILGMGYYTVRYVIFGADWASAPFNATAFRRGVLAVGVVNDRNGVELAGVTDGRRSFADSAEVRRATLHAVGDTEGNVGTGALVAFAPELMGYNLITGSYSVGGSGRRVSLTVDSNLNATALRALDGRRGVVMVSNYKTGEILCMVSSPTFDPANPPDNFASSSYEGVFLNRGIQSDYTPGSVFKLVTAAAAIEKVRNVYTQTFVCTGSMEIGGDLLICPGQHGSIDIERGMQVSCNIVYGSLAMEMSADIMAEYTAKYGLSSRNSVSGINTASGNFDRASSNINLAWSGVGQYRNLVCPASMLRFVGAIANDGTAVELHYLKRTGIFGALPASSSRIINRSTALQLSDLIEIQNRDSFPGLEIYAKSGTAQVGSNVEPHAWYVGYITNPGYPLAFVVVVENGGGGFAVASPIANRVLQEAIK